MNDFLPTLENREQIRAWIRDRAHFILVRQLNGAWGYGLKIGASEGLAVTPEGYEFRNLLDLFERYFPAWDSEIRRPAITFQQNHFGPDIEKIPKQIQEPVAVYLQHTLNNVDDTPRDALFDAMFIMDHNDAGYLHDLVSNDPILFYDILITLNGGPLQMYTEGRVVSEPYLTIYPPINPQEKPISYQSRVKDPEAVKRIPFPEGFDPNTPEIKHRYFHFVKQPTHPRKLTS